MILERTERLFFVMQIACFVEKTCVILPQHSNKLEIVILRLNKHSVFYCASKPKKSFRVEIEIKSGTMIRRDGIVQKRDKLGGAISSCLAHNFPPKNVQIGKTMS